MDSFKEMTVAVDTSGTDINEIVLRTPNGMEIRTSRQELEKRLGSMNDTTDLLCNQEYDDEQIGNKPFYSKLKRYNKKGNKR